MAEKTIENTIRYPSQRCHHLVRRAAELLGTSASYPEVKATLEVHAKTRPYLLALRYGALVGLLEERYGEAGLDMYVRYANWLTANVRVKE